VLAEVAALAAYETAYVEHISSTHRTYIRFGQGHNRNGRALSGNELHLKRIVGVPMHDRAYVTLLEADVRQGAA
jgi:hypothetical protein